MATTIITLANHSLSAARPRTSTAPRVINMPNRHRRAPPNDGQKIPPTTHQYIRNIRLADLIVSKRYAGLKPLDESIEFAVVPRALNELHHQHAHALADGTQCRPHCSGGFTLARAGIYDDQSTTDVGHTG